MPHHKATRSAHPPSKKIRTDDGVTSQSRADRGSSSASTGCSADSVQVPAPHEPDVACDSAYGVANPSGCGHAFVLCPARKLYVAEVHGPQLLKDAVVDVIPCLAHAFGLHTSNIVMHCQGTLPDTASISVAEAGFTDGHTLTMWRGSIHEYGTIRGLAWQQLAWLHAVRNAKEGNLQASGDLAMGRVSILYRQLLKHSGDGFDLDDWHSVVHSLLTCNSIPVLTSVLHLCQDKSTSYLAQAHHAASSCLSSIEGYLHQVLQMTNHSDLSQQERAELEGAVPAVLFLTLELTVHSMLPAEQFPDVSTARTACTAAESHMTHSPHVLPDVSTAHLAAETHVVRSADPLSNVSSAQEAADSHMTGSADQFPDDSTAGEAAEPHVTNSCLLRKLAEQLRSVQSEWSPDMFPKESFDASCLKHAVRQLAVCIPEASKIITMGLLDLAQYILTFGERPGQAPKLPKNLELTGSYSILVQAFVALHAPGAPSTTSHIMASYRELVAAVIKCASACGCLADMIGHLNIAMPADAADPFRSETKTLTTKQYFVRGLTPLFKDHIAALLPGLHALTCSNLWASHAEAAEAQSLFCEVMKLRAVEASLKVEDLRPGGCLVSGALHEFDDFAQHLSQRLRKQYLHDLFPDESQQPMYQDEEPWREFTVSRQRLVADSEAQELTLTKKMGVVFEGEPGVGIGVTKEWLTAYAGWLFSPKSGLWQPCSSDPAALHPCHMTGRFYRCGQVAGLALKYRCPLGVQLSCCFLTELSDRASNDAVYDQVDATVHQSIKAVTRASEEELQQMNLTFECPTGGAFPDQSEGSYGEPVTRKNVDEYVKCMLAHYFSCKDEATLFLAGLESMSGFEEWLNVNNDNDWHSVKIPMLRPVLLEDLGVMLSGELAPLCVEEWRARTAGHGFHYVDGQKDLDQFWQMVKLMTDEQRRRLLQFWTSFRTLPAGGFKELPQPLLLHASHQKLPTSHTCIYQLNVPRFSTESDMAWAFDMALNESEGFGFA